MASHQLHKSRFIDIYIQQWRLTCAVLNTESHKVPIQVHQQTTEARNFNIFSTPLFACSVASIKVTDHLTAAWNGSLAATESVPRSPKTVQ